MRALCSYFRDLPSARSGASSGAPGAAEERAEGAPLTLSTYQTLALLVLSLVLASDLYLWEVRCPAAERHVCQSTQSFPWWCLLLAPLSRKGAPLGP